MEKNGRTLFDRQKSPQWAVMSVEEEEEEEECRLYLEKGKMLIYFLPSVH
jgi:hypothetical protein